jgi:urate oxidase
MSMAAWLASKDRSRDVWRTVQADAAPNFRSARAPLQHTLYAMGEAVLNNFDNVREIHLSLPNKLFNLIDLESLEWTTQPRSICLPMSRAA